MNGHRTCAFESCWAVSYQCALVGGCVNHGRHVVPPSADTPAPVVYNPMTGGRVDLAVNADEDPAVVAARWKAKRIAFLERLLEQELTPYAEGCYLRELQELRR